MNLTIDTVDPMVDDTSKSARRKPLPAGRATSATLSSLRGRIIVYCLMFIWTVPTFGILV